MVRTSTVDDSAMIRFHLRVMLERRAEWVVAGEACNGRHAGEACREHKPDLTSIDLDMPEMNGPEAVRAWFIKSECAHSDRSHS